MYVGDGVVSRLWVSGWRGEVWVCIKWAVWRERGVVVSRIPPYAPPLAQSLHIYNHRRPPLQELSTESIRKNEEGTLSSRPPRGFVSGRLQHQGLGGLRSDT